jgi:hypothetical protein
MPNPTDQYLVIRSFLDNVGNSYQAREQPYLYGELPIGQRDNTVFCVPKNDIEIETEVITKDSKEVLGRQTTDTIEFKTKQIATKVKPKEIVSTEKINKE